MPENLVSRDGFSRPVPRQPAHLHIQAESGAYSRDSSRLPRRRPFMKPPYAIGSVPSLSGHAIAYRWRSLPRARRHRASTPQGSSERVLPWQVTMDQLICASLSHTHYCTLTLVAMQGHQKIVVSIVLILHWLLVWSKYSAQNSSVTFTMQTVLQYYTVSTYIIPVQKEAKTRW